jgi:hypothetical protein
MMRMRAARRSRYNVDVCALPCLHGLCGNTLHYVRFARVSKLLADQLMAYFDGVRMRYQSEVKYTDADASNSNPTLGLKYPIPTSYLLPSAKRSFHAKFALRVEWQNKSRLGHDTEPPTPYVVLT